MFRASVCPSSGENSCIYATLVFVTLCGWRLVGWLDLKHVSGIKVPIIRRKSLYLCDTGICHSGWVASGQLVGLKTFFGHPSAHHQEKDTMRHWYLSLWMGGVWSAGWIEIESIQPADQTPPTQSKKYERRIDTLTFSWWWALGCPKHVEKRHKYIYKQKCAPSWIFLRLCGDSRSTKHRILL